MTTTVYSIFKDTVSNMGSRVAARYKKDGQWHDVTWSEMNAQVNQIAAALAALQIEKEERISIISNTRYEWVAADMGILGACCTTVPIYQSSIPGDIEYILNDAGVVAIFAEDSIQLEKLRGLRKEIPNVKKVICFNDADVDTSSDWEISWSQFLQGGSDYLVENPSVVEQRTAAIKADDLLTLVYTSGTTGRPKGVMITHDNMVYEAEAIYKVGLIGQDDNQLLFLPLAHIFAKVLEVTWLKAAHVMSFAEAIDKVVENMAEVRPTFMASVPRIFEKVHAKVVGGASSAPGIKGKLARWALAKGEEAAKQSMKGETPSGLGWALAQKLVISKIAVKLKELFGGQLRFFVSGGAPLSPDIAYFFAQADVTILEGYGLTETSAATCVNNPGEERIGTVGNALPGTEVKIAEDGEILIRGRGVFKGYWNREEATAEAITEDGWFKSGDIGVIEDGYVRITDRKKDIIVTAGGKNIAPQNIENLVKSKCPLISQVVIHGDKRKFLSALITLDEITLTDWAKSNEISGDYGSLTQNDQVRQVVDSAIEIVNNDLARYETIKKYDVLEKDFSIESGELTPSMKVKRNVINKNYQERYDAFYA
ncbi:MAG: AMP-dependent synthetase [Myxococcales bacterium]|nr:AMP-dependent synthetase [Myxococcales bacterium]